MEEEQRDRGLDKSLKFTRTKGKPGGAGAALFSFRCRRALNILYMTIELRQAPFMSGSRTCLFSIPIMCADLMGGTMLFSRKSNRRRWTQKAQIMLPGLLTL